MKDTQMSTDNVGTVGTGGTGGSPGRVIGRRGFLAAVAAAVGVVATGFSRQVRRSEADTGSDATSNVSNFPARHFVSGDELAG